MEPILRLHKVRHQYNQRTVLDIPELSLPSGSITGLAGPNGSGKSTLLKILSLMEQCSSGTVYVNNKATPGCAGEMRQLLTFLPQETYLLKRTVFDNVSYGLKVRGKQKNLRVSVFEALELVGLPTSFADRQWYELSGGEAQRVALAARLALKPACLMLDEPTVSVDLESARSIHRAILSARQEWGTTLVIASHHQSWLGEICDRIVYLYNGRLLDCSYENVLLGPWEKFSNDLFVMTMTDGQRLYVCEPPQLASSGVIAPQLLRISSSPPSKKEKKISGLVAGVFVDKQPGIFCIHVACGDQQFTVNMPEKDFQKEGISPNQQVSLLYKPSDIVWLS
jgi:tungstate transport system ATP-binding protein